MWRSLVAHFVRDEGAAGSNPVIPIFLRLQFCRDSRNFAPGLSNAVDFQTKVLYGAAEGRKLLKVSYVIWIQSTLIAID